MTREETHSAARIAGFAVLLLGCAVVLASVNAITREPIEANRHSARIALLEDLLGHPVPASAASPDNGVDNGADNGVDNGMNNGVDNVVYCAGTLTVLSLVTQGYGGEIELLAALNRSGPELVGLRTVRHQETPGLGDFIDTSRDPWLRRFDHSRSTDTIDSVTGATITSNAIRRAAHRALEADEWPDCGQPSTELSR